MMLSSYCYFVTGSRLEIFVQSLTILIHRLFVNALWDIVFYKYSIYSYVIKDRLLSMFYSVFLLIDVVTLIILVCQHQDDIIPKNFGKFPGTFLSSLLEYSMDNSIQFEQALLFARKNVPDLFTQGNIIVTFLI